MRNISYDKFSGTIAGQAGKMHFPLRVMFELTYDCNFKCRHCYIPKSYVKKYRHDQLSTKEVCLILYQLKEIGCLYLGFTGGEPFMRRDFFDILKFAKECGFEVIIYSNGSLVSAKVAKKLAGLNLHKVDITIPAISKKVFKRVTGAHRPEAVLNGIKLLREHNVPLGVKTCILKENEPEIDKISVFSSRLNIAHRYDDFLSRRLDGSSVPLNYRGRNIFRELNQGKSFADSCPEAKPDKSGSQRELFYCGAGSMQAGITPAGELKFCVMIDHPKYRILDSSLRECWQGLNLLQSSIKPDKHYRCTRCTLANQCVWCPAFSWNKDRTFTKCDPELRWLAGAKKAQEK